MTNLFHRFQTVSRLGVAVLVLLFLGPGCSRTERAPTGTTRATDIQGLSYDWDNRDLTIRLAGGVNYTYAQIHPKTFELFRDSKTPRRFYENTIRGRASFAGFENARVLDLSSEEFETIAYHAPSRLLLVQFDPRSVFEYLDVPEAEVEALLDAESVPQYFAQNIRGTYEANRL